MLRIITLNLNGIRSAWRKGFLPWLAEQHADFVCVQELKAHLADLDEGDATSLNSRKWKLAGFFNRMKSQVREEWHPDQPLSKHDPSGNIYGSKDRMTMLKVELFRNGHVKEVSVLKPSGVEFLDDEAMSAFRRAQPFANPPEQLADPDGIIRFQFGFVVQVSGFTSFRIRKY